MRSSVKAALFTAFNDQSPFGDDDDDYDNDNDNDDDNEAGDDNATLWLLLT